MLHVIGLILKIIGIILGILIGTLLLVLILALLVPIRYKIEFEKNAEDMKADVKFSWLFHIIFVRFCLSKGVSKLTFRIFGFSIFDSGKPKKVKKKRKSTVKTEESKAIEAGETVTDTIKEIGGKAVDLIKDEVKEDVYAVKENLEIQDEPEETKAAKDAKATKVTLEENEVENKEKKGFIKKIVSKINGIIQKIKDMLTSSIDLMKKLRDIKVKVNEIKAILLSEENKRGYRKIIAALKKIGKHLKPRRIKGNILFGSDDPYVTGQIFTYFGMFYGLYGKNFDLQADFNENRLEGEISIKGRIRLGTLLFIVVKLVLSKDVRGILKSYNRLKETYFNLPSKSPTS